MKKDRRELELITVDGKWLKDSTGRIIHVRGVNAVAKLPTSGAGDTLLRTDLFNHKDLSFVGAPIKLEEADEHFSRLKLMGYHFIRLGFPWEAVEHEGPGLYDQAYLTYLRTLIEIAETYDLYILIDIHQDVASRFTGGSGAPGWALESIGLALEQLEETGAAVLHSTNPIEPKSMHLLWVTNGFKLAAATFFTLFFAGNRLAPGKEYQGVPIQDFLQERYLSMLETVAKALHGLKNVIGYDLFNEPLSGYIETADLNTQSGFFSLGASPTPFQGMALGSGFPTLVDYYSFKYAFFRKTGKRELNLEKKRAWKEGVDCIWKEMGIWKEGKEGPELLRPHYFAEHKIEFEKECYQPFIQKAAARIHQVTPSAMICIEHVMGVHSSNWEHVKIPQALYTPHWYDPIPLALRRFSSIISSDMFERSWTLNLPSRIRTALLKQMIRLKDRGKRKYGDMPCLITEWGIPDLFNDVLFRKKERALNRSFTALEDSFISSFIWQYFPRSSGIRGDLWNGEHFSIFCRDYQKSCYDLLSGVKAVKIMVRPYPMRTAGTPLQMQFNPANALFRYTFMGDSSIDEPTLIFLPKVHYGERFNVLLSDGSYTFDPENQTLSYHPAEKHKKHIIRIMPLE